MPRKSDVDAPAQVERNPMVLIADERHEALTTLHQLLENAGYRVGVACSPRVAVEMLAIESPDVLVVHSGLLGAGESNLLCQVRTVAPAVPIIVRTAGQGGGPACAALASPEINAVHDDAHDITHLVDLIGCAATSARFVERLRTEHEARCLTLAKLCHSVRSPLHVIQGYTEVLREDPAAQPFADILDRIGHATEAAIRLVHEHLARVRLEVPDPVVRRELVKIDVLVAELQAQAVRQIGSRAVRLLTSVQFRGASIQTDHEKLRGILGELLANAIKFTPVGTVSLGVQGAGGSTAFTVIDQGPGISDADLVTLFSPFRQRSSEAVASLPGQGIGLAIARRLSTLIGASLAAERGEGGGAVFTLTVPEPMFVQTLSAAGCALH